jgi:hypothetical protein
MKRFFLAIFLLTLFQLVRAQSAKLYIVNHTDYEVRVRMYGQASATCPAGCSSTYITNTISLMAPSSPAYPSGSTTWGPFDPCNVSTGVGWAYAACPTAWCSSLPTDFQWTLAVIDLPFATIWPLGTFPMYVCPTQPTCSPATGTVYGPVTASPPAWPWNIKAEWFSTGGSLADVTIVIDQY